MKVDYSCHNLLNGNRFFKTEKKSLLVQCPQCAFLCVCNILFQHFLSIVQSSRPPPDRLKMSKGEQLIFYRIPCTYPLLLSYVLRDFFGKGESFFVEFINP